MDGMAGLWREGETRLEARVPSVPLVLGTTYVPGWGETSSEIPRETSDIHFTPLSLCS